MAKTIKKERNRKHEKFLASIGLLMVSVIWGSAFVLMKNSMDVIMPTYLLAYRFTIAALGLFFIYWKTVKTMTRQDIFYGGILGFFLFISFYFQTYGLKYTTASKNAFITTLYVIIVPFLHWLFNKAKPTKNHAMAAVIAVIALALLSLKGDRSINLGDFLTLICGFCYAIHMVLIDRYTVCYHPIKLTVMQMASAAFFAWIMAFIFEGPCDLSVFRESQTVISLLYLGLISSMLCFLIQTIGQTYLSPNTSSILLSFESVFGLIFSVWFLKEDMTGKMLIGCGLMFLAALLSEYSPSQNKKGIREEQEYQAEA